MKILFIGGTGNISSAVSRLAIKKGFDLYLLNRGKNKITIDGAKNITCDINDYTTVKKALKDTKWDVVVNWIAFTKDDILRDIDLFYKKTDQYIFISSASAYQKPLTHPVITESTPLKNPYWDYSQDKIKCENLLTKACQEKDFPVTIVRPSLSYETVIPVAIGGWTEYTIIDRIKKGKEIIVHGDGTSLWTITHSRDFAKGFIGLLGNTQTIGHAFHITSDELLNWDQIYQIVANAAGYQANIIHIPSDFICHIDPSYTGTLIGDKAVSTIFDNSKIKRFVPDFKVIIPFKRGFKDTLKWFEEKPERMIINKDTDQMMDKIINTYKKIFN